MESSTGNPNLQPFLKASIAFYVIKFVFKIKIVKKIW